MLSISTMRRLDTLLGIPAVFAMKALHRLPGVGRVKPLRPEDVRNVLILKCFGMGSLLLARPLMAEARRRFPEARVHLLTFSANRRLAERIPEVDVIHILDTSSRGTFVRSVLRHLWRLRRTPVDLSFDLEFFSKFTSFCSLAVGAPWRAGFFLATHWRAGVYTHCGYFNSNQHVVLVFLAQLYYALSPPSRVSMDLPDMNPGVLLGRLPPLRVEAEEISRVERLLAGAKGRRIALNPNAGELSFLRRWPAEHWSRLIRELSARDPQATFYLLGSPEDREYVDRICADDGESAAGKGEETTGVRRKGPENPEPDGSDRQIVNLAGSLSIGQLLALLARVDLLISNDSGPLHMAAVQGIDTISFFGPETPRLYGPAGRGRHCVIHKGLFCSPCLNVYNNKHTECRDNVCLKSISVAEAVEAYEEWRNCRPAGIVAGE